MDDAAVNPPASRSLASSGLAAMHERTAEGALREALDSKRAVRERLVRALRRALPGALDALPPQVPLAGAADSAMAPARDPLGAFLLETIAAPEHASAIGASVGATARV
jgi:hypothetical protein